MAWTFYTHSQTSHDVINIPFLCEPLEESRLNMPWSINTFQMLRLIFRPTNCGCQKGHDMCHFQDATEKITCPALHGPPAEFPGHTNDGALSMQSDASIQSWIGWRHGEGSNDRVLIGLRHNMYMYLPISHVYVKYVDVSRCMCMKKSKDIQFLCGLAFLPLHQLVSRKPQVACGRIMVLNPFRLGNLLLWEKSAVYSRTHQPTTPVFVFGASGCHVCAARVKHKSQQVSKDKRGNSGLYVNLASPKNISKVSVKGNAQIRIMFSNDSFRIGNISTLYISDSRGDQSRFGRLGRLPHRASENQRVKVLKMKILRNWTSLHQHFKPNLEICHNSCEDQWIEWGKFRESCGDFPEMTAKKSACLFHEFYMLNVLGNWNTIRLATQVVQI